MKIKHKNLGFQDVNKADKTTDLAIITAIHVIVALANWSLMGGFPGWQIVFFGVQLFFVYMMYYHVEAGHGILVESLMNGYTKKYVTAGLGASLWPLYIISVKNVFPTQKIKVEKTFEGVSKTGILMVSTSPATIGAMIFSPHTFVADFEGGRDEVMRYVTQECEELLNDILESMAPDDIAKDNPYSIMTKEDFDAIKHIESVVEHISWKGDKYSIEQLLFARFWRKYPFGKVPNTGVQVLYIDLPRMDYPAATRERIQEARISVLVAGEENRVTDLKIENLNSNAKKLAAEGMTHKDAIDAVTVTSGAVKKEIKVNKHEVDLKVEPLTAEALADLAKLVAKYVKK